MKIITLTVLLVIAFTFKAQDSIKKIPIQWINLDSINAEFTENWDYPEGIYINRWGQVGCDGFCPGEFYGLSDDQGKIKEENLELAYSILDTTHEHYSLECKARAYQFGESNYIRNVGVGDLIQLVTSTSASTHTQFILNLTHPENYITTYIYFNSIVSDSAPTSFLANDGWIKVDPNEYAKGIFIAQFSFTYYNHLEPEEELFWSGTIYTSLK